jgi:hypothetical protein
MQEDFTRQLSENDSAAGIVRTEGGSKAQDSTTVPFSLVSVVNNITAIANEEVSVNNNYINNVASASHDAGKVGKGGGGGGGGQKSGDNGGGGGRGNGAGQGQQGNLHVHDSASSFMSKSGQQSVCLLCIVLSFILSHTRWTSRVLADT